MLTLGRILTLFCAVGRGVFPGVRGAWSVPAAEERCGVVHRVAERR